MGDGAAAWNALNERFDAQNQEARRACHNEPFNLRHKAGGDPIDFFTKGWDLKLRLVVLGEEVSHEVYQDSYDAMTIRRDPHERVSYSSSRQRILGT